MKKILILALVLYAVQGYTQQVLSNGGQKITPVTAIPSPRIPYGNGTGMTNTPALVFDSIVSNGQFTQRVLRLGDTVTTNNRRLEGLVIDNTYGRTGTGGLGNGWTHSPLSFKSPTKCAECTDFLFQREVNSTVYFPGSHPDTTLNEITNWGHNISSNIIE